MALAYTFPFLLSSPEVYITIENMRAREKHGYWVSGLPMAAPRSIRNEDERSKEHERYIPCLVG
jgi:hypothetical protein